MNPIRWNMYVVDLEPRVGSKPGKQRPCICLQPTEFCQSGLNSAVVLPLTTKLITGDTYPIRVRIPKGVCGIKNDSDALVDQILAWDISLFRQDLGQIPEALQIVLKNAVKDFLDL